MHPIAAVSLYLTVVLQLALRHLPMILKDPRLVKSRSTDTVKKNIKRENKRAITRKIERMVDWD